MTTSLHDLRGMARAARKRRRRAFRDLDRHTLVVCDGRDPVGARLAAAVSDACRKAALAINRWLYAKKIRSKG